MFIQTSFQGIRKEGGFENCSIHKETHSFNTSTYLNKLFDCSQKTRRAKIYGVKILLDTYNEFTVFCNTVMYHAAKNTIVGSS